MRCSRNRWDLSGNLRILDNLPGPNAKRCTLEFKQLRPDGVSEQMKMKICSSEHTQDITHEISLEKDPH